MFGALMALVAALAFGGPKERFVKTSYKYAATSTNELVISSFNGVAFTPQKASIYIFSGVDAGATTTLTVYIPYNTGPLAAAAGGDSFTVDMLMKGGNDNRWFDYYGPMSDTMRVAVGGNGAYIAITTYGN